VIEQQVFKASREAARLELSSEEAKNSFGYYIDIPNNWESYRCPEELIPFLGIHSTHIAHFQEIIADLGPLTKEEHGWIKHYVGLYENITKLLSTTREKVDFRYDIAETLFDWRTVQKFANFPCRILDFGAGCGRQGVSAFLKNPENIYTAIDSTLAAYTIQNLVFSYLDTLNPDYHSSDFLDFEAAAKPFPKINHAPAGSRFHLPTWLAEENIPERYYDIIFACHVHNELSGPDFMRLMRIIEKGLAQDGILYLRSELTVIDPYDFFDAVDLHAIDPVKLLGGNGIVPVYSILDCAYLATVFAREDSSHHKKALKSGLSENCFTEAKRAVDISTVAGSNFVKRHFENAAKSGKKVAMIGDLIDFVKLHVKTQDYKNLLKHTFGGFFDKHMYTEKQFMEPDNDSLLKQFCEYSPDIIIISSYQYEAIEEKIKRILPNREYTVRRQYWFPVVFLYGKSVLRTDDIFNAAVLSVKDLL